MWAAGAVQWQNISNVLVHGGRRGMVYFLPPGLLCRWAWHTGLPSPDSQISSHLAQLSWVANPLLPVSELRCSANDRVFRKKHSLILKIRWVAITLPQLLFVPLWAGFADIIFLHPYWKPAALWRAKRQIATKKTSTSTITRCHTPNCSWCITNTACLTAKSAGWVKTF